MIGLVLSLVALAPAFQQQAQPLEADTYVFGSLVIDTKRKMAHIGPYKSLIRDCSSTETFCLSTNFLTLAGPRSCQPLAAGESFTAGGRRFEVLGAVTALPASHGASETVYLISGPDQTNVLFVYSVTSGVSRIFISMLSQENFYSEFKAAASEGRLQAKHDERLGDGLWRITYSPLFGCLPKQSSCASTDCIASLRSQ